MDYKINLSSYPCVELFEILFLIKSLKTLPTVSTYPTISALTDVAPVGHLTAPSKKAFISP